jgi:hypothetical protein
MKRLAIHDLRGSWKLLLGAAVAFLPSWTFAARPIPSFATTVPTAISCDGTPFGHYVTLGQDAEMITEAATSGSFNAFDEYTPTLTRDIRSTLLQTGLTGAQFQKGVSVDFNGDGKDEVVTANKLTNGNLMLAVYHRDAAPSAVLFDTWTLSQNFGSVDLVAGDFAGNNDGSQQLAVLVRIGSNLRVIVLTGAPDGSIAQADNAFAGNWLKSGTNNPVSLARGDVLLDHRDQIIVVNETGSGGSRVLNYNLLEYLPSTAQLPVGAGNTSIGSMAFTDAVGSSFVNNNGSSEIDQINKIKINAGDLVDTAAAELVLNLQASNDNGSFIGQRLYHFVVTRAGGLITQIALSNDFSHLVQGVADNGLMTWDSTIANVDGVSPNEIVIARADGSNIAQKVEAYYAYRVENTPVTNPPTYSYKLNTTPAYTGSVVTESTGQDMALMGVAVGDMDADGLAEIMTVVRDAQSVRRSRWTLSTVPNSTTLVGTHVTESIGSNNYTALGIQAADFDGDSVHANVAADNIVNALCQQVREPTLRSVVWWPPYFQKLQGDTGQQNSSFGKSLQTGASSETSFGTFTSDDVSFSLGAKVGGEVLGIGAEAEVKATAGYNYQATYGKTSSVENTLDTSESFQQATGEGLVVMEENTFDCYSYTIARNSTGVADDSSMRLCRVLSDQKAVSGTDAENWDTNIPAAPVDRPPAQWFPLQRDWASLSLFRPVTTNATFVAGHGADQITDGLFDSGTDSGAAINQPYLQVDLGALYDIADIRVFPVAGQAPSLKNFRVYASPSPMNGAAVPTGSSVRVYTNENSAGFSYDQWNIWTNSPGNTLRARYVRLQLPNASGSLHVAELQVFGDVHVEVQRYPQAVCDPHVGDHTFNASVWDPGSLTFSTIQVRGDMLWNGSPEDQSWCTNDAKVIQSPIWAQISIGDSASVVWDLSSATQNMVGTTKSIESSTRVGAELDVSGGFVAQVTASGAYEHSTGVTQDSQSSTFWGSGLQMSGTASAFSADYRSLVPTCHYRPQPYAYELEDLSNTGYKHTMYVVDYVVREGAPFWTRSNVPEVCVTRQDPIFIGNFD